MDDGTNGPAGGQGGGVPAADRSPAPDGPSQRLVYDGRLGALYRIFIVNLLLALATLGIYRFWGKTRMRRYLWSHVSYDGDRLEYTGTGGELFRGFLIVAAILVVLGLLLGLAQLAVMILLVEDPGTQIVLQQAASALFYVVAFFLVLLGHYTALRYRLTRTRWRGIRGGLSGSAWRYAWTAFRYVLLRIATLGLYAPFATVRLWAYRINNVHFGTARASFEGSGRQIFKPFLISFLASLAAFAVAFGGAWLAEGGAIEHAAALLDADVGPGRTAKGGVEARVPLAMVTLARFIAIFVALSLLASFIALVAHCWYWTKLLSLMARGTMIAGLRFSATPRTGRLWWLIAGNFLIGLFTLGLGLPIVLHRLWRFVAENLHIEGVIDGAAIAQSQQLAPSRGEGVLEVLDPSPF